MNEQPEPGLIRIQAGVAANRPFELAWALDANLRWKTPCLTSPPDAA